MAGCHQVCNQRFFCLGSIRRGFETDASLEVAVKSVGRLTPVGFICGSGTALRYIKETIEYFSSLPPRRRDVSRFSRIAPETLRSEILTVPVRQPHFLT